MSTKAREGDARADRLIGGRENGQIFPICSPEPDADATFVSCPRFRVESALGGVRVVASANGGEPAVWFVPGRPGFTV